MEQASSLPWNGRPICVEYAGVAAIQAIRALPAGAGLPILAFTASADQPTHHRAMAAGANGVLVKPLSEEELINAVYETLLGFDAPLVTIPTT